MSKLSFEKYQDGTAETAIYPEEEKFNYLSLGLAGETGEVAEKFKRIIRDEEKEVDEEFKEDMEKELGDVLWYLTRLIDEMDLNLEEVADRNLEKLLSRKKRKKLKGEGDNR